MMTVRELKAMLKYLPSDMEVYIPSGERDLISLCTKSSSVIMITVEAQKRSEKVLLLQPTMCVKEFTKYDINLTYN